MMKFNLHFMKNLTLPFNMPYLSGNLGFSGYPMLLIADCTVFEGTDKC
jgi:hypothetical protein